MNQRAVRRGDWKLVLDGQLVKDEPPADAVFLTNLREDPGETENLAEAHPEIRRNLEASLRDWYRQIDQDWEANWSYRMNAPALLPD